MGNITSSDTNEGYTHMDIPFVDSTLGKISYNIGRKSINIPVIGEVSCGKSTFLNSIFVHKYGNTRKARTTMSVNIYQESASPQQAAQINEALQQYEKKYSQDKDIDNIKKIEEYGFPVEKIKKFQSIPKDYSLNLIDVPGFNDASNNELLYEWLNKSVYLFDIFFFMINIDNGLNTASELELLDKVFDHLEKYKHISVIFVFNKYDDYSDKDSKSDGFWYDDDDENKNMYDEGIKCITKHASDHKIKMTRISIIPFCAELSYIYRTVFFTHKFDGLTGNQAKKLCVDTFGKKQTASLSPDKLIVKILNECDWINDYDKCKLNIPGFKQFEDAFNGKLVQIDQIFIEKIKHLLNNINSNVNIKINEDVMDYVAYFEKSEPEMAKQCFGVINQIVNKFVDSSKGLGINGFIKMMVVRMELIRKYCRKVSTKIFTEKSVDKIQQQTFDKWYYDLSNDFEDNYSDYVVPVLLKSLDFEPTMLFTNAKEFDQFISVLVNYSIMNTSFTCKKLENWVSSCLQQKSTSFQDCKSICVSLMRLHLQTTWKEWIIKYVVDFVFLNSGKFKIYQMANYCEFLNDISSMMLIGNVKNIKMMTGYIFKILKQCNSQTWYLYLILKEQMKNGLITEINHPTLYYGLNYAVFGFQQRPNLLLECKFVVGDSHKFTQLTLFFEENNK